MDIFGHIKNELNGWEIKSVAQAADLHPITLNRWIDGKTLNPHIKGLIRVANAIGFDVKLIRRKAILKLVG